ELEVALGPEALAALAVRPALVVREPVPPGAVEVLEGALVEGGQRPADGLGLLEAEDAARALAPGGDAADLVEKEDGVVAHVLEDEAVALLGLAQLAHGGAALAADAGLLHLAVDGGAQAGEVVLREEVVGAGLHRLDGDLLADAARDDDERQVLAARLEQL